VVNKHLHKSVTYIDGRETVLQTKLITSISLYLGVYARMFSN